MKKIELLENAKGKQITFGELGVHRTFYWAYRNSHEAETEILDFDDVVWEYDIPEIVENLRRFGLGEFTISCGMSSMAETIATFEKNGCRLIGMTEVKTRYFTTTADWQEERKTKPAFLLRVN